VSDDDGKRDCFRSIKLLFLEETIRIDVVRLRPFRSGIAWDAGILKVVQKPGETVFGALA
jgi:hypothetical protein